MSEQKKKIIIIDDVELNRAILSEAFSKKYDVIEANDGSEGLNKIYENENDLAAIFLDVIMPEMDGFSVLQELENNNIMKRIPLFIITSEATDYVVEKVYDYGVVDVIQKPFNLLIIERRVENIIELYKRRIDEKLTENTTESSFAQDNAPSQKEVAYKKALANIAKIINDIPR